jgi:hypothetical protein
MDGSTQPNEHSPDSDYEYMADDMGERPDIDAAVLGKSSVKLIREILEISKGSTIPLPHPNGKPSIDTDDIKAVAYDESGPDKEGHKTIKFILITAGVGAAAVVARFALHEANKGIKDMRPKKRT